MQMRVVQLWRYPVKSLAGEQRDFLEIEDDGAAGDRAFGILDLASDQILTGRREPRLLFAAAMLDANGAPRITLPDGTMVSGLGPGTDAALSAWLGKPVQLVAAAGRPAARAVYFKDATDDESAPIEWTMPKGRFVDAAAILVMTTAALRAGARAHPTGDWDIRRFRPNVVVEAEGEGWIEDAWCGRVVRAGEVGLSPRRTCIRCTMVTRAQPGLPKDIDTYKALARTHGGDAGVWSDVSVPGTLRVGDPVEAPA